MRRFARQGTPTLSATSNPRRRPGPEQDALRRDILAAVRTLHLRGGNDAVTMRAVADTVGLSAMGLYRYFPNRSALVMGAWDEALADALAASQARLRPRDDALARLRAFYAGYIDYWLEHPHAWRMMFDVQRGAAEGEVFAGGPAAEFRAQAQSLVAACLPSAGPADSRRAHDLCRCKVLGYLFLAIGIGAATGNPRTLRDTVLDDIVRQLGAGEPGKAAPARRALTRTRSAPG
jgi:AcrR family transcriptional regulator